MDKMGPRVKFVCCLRGNQDGAYGRAIESAPIDGDHVRGQTHASESRST